MKKRGLSEVVTTLIIILLTLVAIAVIWVVISNLLEEKSQKISILPFTKVTSMSALKNTREFCMFSRFIVSICPIEIIIHGTRHKPFYAEASNGRQI